MFAFDWHAIAMITHFDLFKRYKTALNKQGLVPIYNRLFLLHWMNAFKTHAAGAAAGEHVNFRPFKARSARAFSSTIWT